nr:MAG TPA: hypothetical protein [Caudoviricetes sp.]
MLGISIFSLFVVYAILGIGYTLNKMGRHISSYSGKSIEDAPKLTVEDMYSPNNKLSSFVKTDSSCSILVSNHIIDKEEFVFADNPTNLRNKVARVLRNYAALERDKNKDIVIL